MYNELVTDLLKEPQETKSIKPVRKSSAYTSIYLLCMYLYSGRVREQGDIFHGLLEEPY